MSNHRDRVLITDPISEEGISRLQQQAEVQVVEGLDAQELREMIGRFDALIVRGRTLVTQGVVSAGQRLRVIGRAGIGVDNIDLSACDTAGIIVVNSPLATVEAVAEHTLAMMLGLSRHLVRGDRAVKGGEWPKKELLGTELQGKTLSLIGMGRIGTRVAELASAFGMRVLAADPFLPDEQIQARGAEPAELEVCLSEADYISLHVPRTEKTRHMVNDEAISMMKDGVRMISAARGGIIEEAALLRGLESGKIGGAALDVFEREPPGAIDLVLHPHVLASPHLGAQTIEAQRRAGLQIAEEVINALAGAPLRWQVNA